MNKFIIVAFALTVFCLGSCSEAPRAGFDAVVTAAPVKERVYKPTVWPDRIMQSVAQNPATQISLSWRTSGEIINGFVEYLPVQSTIIDPDRDEIQKKNASIKQVRYENIHDHYFEATIEGLNPDTEYMVRVGNNDYRSEWFNVRTAPDRFQPFHFLYFGDIQNDIREFAPRIFRNATKRFPSARFMVHAGDLVLSSGDDDTWGEWFYSGNWLFQQGPSLAVAGNSDHWRWQTSPVDKRLLFPQWNGVFNFPKNGPEGLENLSYYFDYPGVRVVALYTNFESIDGDGKEIYLNHNMQLNDTLFENQLRWLRTVLAGNTQPWLVVVMHHPVFTARKGRYNDLLQKHFLPLLEQYKVDLVLQGHDHVYARGTNPDAANKNQPPVYVISIAGGKTREVDNTHFWLKRHIEDMQLYQAIHITENQLRLDAIDTRGRIVDRFRISRSNTGEKRLLD